VIHASIFQINFTTDIGMNSWCSYYWFVVVQGWWMFRFQRE
jgi:hypothetical protein